MNDPPYLLLRLSTNKMATTKIFKIVVPRVGNIAYIKFLVSIQRVSVLQNTKQLED